MGKEGSTEVFNPFDGDIKTKLVNFFESRPMGALPPTSTSSGSGVYAIFYVGKIEYYSSYFSKLKHPIYVGKAVLPGGRKGAGILSEKPKNYVISRLREHARSIECASSLSLKDFKCKWLVMDPYFVNAAEAILIDHYKPLWNCVISGFGIHPPGKGRLKQARSDWDELHPGREFSKKLPKGRHTKEILKAIRDALTKVVCR